MVQFAEMELQYLQADARYGYFPGVSAAWSISQENFLKNVTFINSLKLRYSWGKLGSTSNVNATNPYNLYATRAGKSFYDLRAPATVPAAAAFTRAIWATRIPFGKVILFPTLVLMPLCLKTNLM